MKKRNLNLDMLRILCMFFVVTIHCLGRGGLIEGTAIKFGTVNYHLTQILNALLIVEVNCFVLISGYFLCTSEFKLKKLVSVWGQTVFYSVFICVLISVIQMFKGEEVFLLKTLIKSILFGPMSRFSTS